MKKIPCVFVREFSPIKGGGITAIHEAVTPGCEWVLAGEGAASAKYDGEAHRIFGGTLWRRYDCKPGRTAPPGFEACEAAPDPVTGHFPGWVPVREDDPAGKWAREAFARIHVSRREDGTYELCGPKIQGNPHGCPEHVLVPHGILPVDVLPTFAGIRDWLQANPRWEGIVWAHPDGRYAKIKRSDFGLPWPPKKV